jgi:hypothetical protein
MASNNRLVEARIDQMPPFASRMHIKACEEQRSEQVSLRQRLFAHNLSHSFGESLHVYQQGGSQRHIQNR